MSCRTNLVLAVSVLCFAVAAAAEKPAPGKDAAPPQETEVRVFSGEVREIVMLSKFAGKAIVVHFDPRFVVRVKVTKPESKDMEPAGSELAYAIHSPALMFGLGAEEAAGRAFNFRETETQQAGPSGRRRSAHWLKATPVDVAQNPGKDEEKK